MKLYGCDLCGRVFYERIPHICIHGNYRKRSLVFTQFEDADCEYVKKSKADVKENNFPNIPQGALILEKPLEPKIEFMINWGQVRIDAAISALQGKLSDHTAMSRLWTLSCEDTPTFYKHIATSCVELADALIAELKKDK